MANVNRRVVAPMVKNHNGLATRTEPDMVKLRRMVLASMLFEDTFYVDGVTSAQMISTLVPKCHPTAVAELMIEARTKHNLRHVPLLLARELARTGNLKAADLATIIQRPDEMGTFLALYWQEKKCAISNQVRKGLAMAFAKFNEYALAKWDKNSAAITIRDVMFMTHPKPANPEQEVLFKKVADKALVTPDTWEVELSAGADKGATFTRLMKENKMGALAFIRNLRNMVQSGVSMQLMAEYASTVNVSKVLPFRYVAARQHVPQLSELLEGMMFKSCADLPKLRGKTVLLVDVSSSMFGPKVSEKSELDRFDAAAALAMLAQEVCEDVTIATFSNQIKYLPKAGRGFALRDELKDSQHHGGTELGKAVRDVHSRYPHARVIVFTDEQSRDALPPAANGGKGYIVNVANYQNGVGAAQGYEKINGFSEVVISYIQELEASGL